MFEGVLICGRDNGHGTDNSQMSDENVSHGDWYCTRRESRRAGGLG